MWLTGVNLLHTHVPCLVYVCFSTTVHLWGQNVWWKNQLLPTPLLQGNNPDPYLGRKGVRMRLTYMYTLVYRMEIQYVPQKRLQTTHIG